jgi:hypothetical protein
MVKRRLVVLMLVAHSAAADDTPLERARKAVEASEYATARPLLAESLASGANGPEQMIELYRLTGITAAALNDEAAAKDAFTRLLALSPKVTLPAGTSPKITRPFAAAGTYFKTHEPLHVKSETSAQPPSITLVIDSDPLRMIASARATLQVDGKPAPAVDGKGSGKIELALPHGDRIELQLVARDVHGNRLVEMGSAEIPIVITGAREPPKVVVTKHPRRVALAPEHPRPWYLAWWAWGGAAIAFGGAATYFGVDTLAKADEMREIRAHSYAHPYQDFQDAEARARLDALLFNISLGTAGAFAIGATILYVTRPGVTVTPVPERGGGALVFGGRF